MTDPTDHPIPPRELVDMEWLYGIQNKDGKPFRVHLAETADEKGAVLAFTFKAQPSDPTLKDKDNAMTGGYLARVNYLHSKAAAYHTKAKGVVAWQLRKKGLNSTMVERVAPAFLSDFQEEADDWAALSDSLHERLWTGRRDLDRLNRAGE